MAEIAVRELRFDFDPELDFDRPGPELASLLGVLGVSLSMPSLEPYLIRTLKQARPRIADPVLAEDVRRFCQQEGHHFRNHARYNEHVRARFDAATAGRLRAIEAALEADYQRFSRERSTRFNVAYAEGFEAMTCAMALASAEHGGFRDPALAPGGEFWAWHMAEEIEHRSVAFQVFAHLDGSYAYRLAVGTWSQLHYLRSVLRFARCMADALGRRLVLPRSALHRAALRRYLATWSPAYDPARIAPPDGVAELLARYSALAASRPGD